MDISNGVMTLGDVILDFLRDHPGPFTARELWERIPKNGKRLFPAHVKLALERRLFPRGFVLADAGVTYDARKALVHSSPGTRWCVLSAAQPGRLIFDPVEGIHSLEEWEVEYFDR